MPLNSITLRNMPSFSTIAHRGYSAEYPENTLVAFEAAIQAGADMSELDVTLTRDRQMVVIHDDHLNRTTTGSGVVRDFSLAEIKKLDAGSWFDRRFRFESVPSLKEALALVKGRGLLNVEIKSSAYEPDHPPDSVERQVVDLIRRQRMIRSTLISSFSRPLLEQLAAIKNHPALALISEESLGKETVAFCRRIRAFSWHPDHRILTADTVDQMHRHGIRVFPWTTLTRGELEKVRDMGVDGVMVNDPTLILNDN